MSDDADAQLSELRELLLGAEKKQIGGLQERLDNPQVHAAEVATVLAEAVALRAGHPDGELERAVAPMVEGAILSSVQKDPHVIADALYPVMGPAIRKAIAETFNTLVQSMNSALEHSLSMKGLLWRMEAARSGTTFAEVVMRHNLVFRVEQIFLIHAKTGLPLEHVVAAEVDAQDTSMVSGMLSALQDFARDSFVLDKNEGISDMKIGDLTVWVDQGPQALLAVALRGNAPQALRTTMHGVLLEVHATHREALAKFEGDPAPFESARPMLERCMASGSRAATKKPPYKLAVLLLAVLGGLGFLLYRGWERDRRFDTFMASVRAQPGVVVHTQERRGGRWYLEGLRDPASKDPLDLAAAAGLDRATIDARWEPYLALVPEMVEVRARAALAPPTGVELALGEDGILVARGAAGHGWIGDARRLARVVPGIVAYDDRGVRDIDEDALPATRSAVDARRIAFSLGDPEPRDVAALDAAARDVSRLAGIARRLEAEIAVVVVGHADGAGKEADNEALSVARAAAVAHALSTRGVPPSVLVTRGVGSREPAGRGTSDADRVANRRVEFRATVTRHPQASDEAP